jgi:hypothetical protein
MTASNIYLRSISKSQPNLKSSISNQSNPKSRPQKPEFVIVGLGSGSWFWFWFGPRTLTLVLSSCVFTFRKLILAWRAAFKSRLGWPEVGDQDVAQAQQSQYASHRLEADEATANTGEHCA